MKSLLLLISLFNHPATKISTDSLPLKHRVYRAQIFNSSTQRKDGYLTEISDSSLAISKTPLPLGMTGLQDGALTKYTYQDISYMQLKRKGSIGRDILIGALAGLTVGVLWGVIEGSDPHVPPEQDFFGFGEAFRLSAGEKALAYGSLLAFAGTVTGAITGAIVKKKFMIGGRKDKFEEMRTNMLDKVYGRQVTR